MSYDVDETTEEDRPEMCEVCQHTREECDYSCPCVEDREE